MARSIRLVMFAFLFAAGCGGGGGGSSPRAECEDLTSGLCQRLYDCYSADELASAGFPSSEHECETMFADAQGCADVTAANACDDTGGSYQPDQADRCVEQVDDLSCDEIRDPNFALETAAPACGKVCN